MEIVRYRPDTSPHPIIYNQENKLIGGGYLSSVENNGKILYIGCHDSMSYAHTCNEKRLYYDKYYTWPYYEIQLMTIEKLYSKNKKLFNLLNEDFIRIKDFSFSAFNESLYKRSFISYNKKWIGNIYLDIILRYEVCQIRFELNTKKIQQLS